MSELKEGEIVGETVAVREYKPIPYECWFFLYPKYENRLELMQTGFVYEIVEEGINDRCYGIVETSTTETDQQVLDVMLSSKKGLSTKAVKLRVSRLSGTDSPVIDRSKVKIAGSEGIRAAYNIPEKGIPIGVFTTPSGYLTQTCAVRIPTEHLLGKEAAHVNIGGKSGYCKTALALVVCKALLSNSTAAKNTCVIAFNVKADDFLYVDQLNPDLEEKDKKLYQIMGVPCEPFKNVTIFAPLSPDGRVNSLRSDAQGFSWEWMDVREKLHFGIAQEDWDERLETILSDLVSQDVNEFREVVALLEDWEREASARGGGGWAHGHHVATIRKTLRIIRRGMIEKYRGLLCGSAGALAMESILTPGQFNVIDINRLGASAQRLVIGKIVSDVQNLLEEGGTKVENVIFLTDELSKFAPKSAIGPIADVKKIYEDVAERGRSVGTVILGMEQYPSMISDSIVGNVATAAYARMKFTELDSSVYRGYPREKKELIKNLAKGFIVVDHDTFNDLILVRFPRPSCRQP